ncbi:MAG: two-component system C4-dicarboxylate transport sensor histidine kinase DctB [Paracoccaceae bacterium]
MLERFAALKITLLSYWLVAFLATLTGVYLVSQSRAENAVAGEATAAAVLYNQAIRAELDRRRHLPELLASDVEIVDFVSGRSIGDMNQKLARIAATTDAEAVYVMDLNGDTIAASNWQSASSFLGQNYAFRRYFLAARDGQGTAEFAVGATTGRPGIFYSYPLRDDWGDVVGVGVVKIDLSDLHKIWGDAKHQVLVINQDGIVVISRKEAWRYKSTNKIDQPTLQAIKDRRQFMGRDLIPLDIKADGGRNLKLDDTRYLRIVEPLAWLNWQLWVMIPQSEVTRRALGSVAYGAVAFLILTIVFVILRTERLGSRLLLSEQQRTHLAQLNLDLNTEIEERKQVEASLLQAQMDLKRSAKLAAMGQLAASVTHELGQPLTAMKTHVKGLQRNVARGKMPTSDAAARIDRLVDRLGSIVKQLRFFASRGGEPMETVDLLSVISGAHETMSPMLKQRRVTIRLMMPTDPVLVTGGQRRLEQVLINLIGNALDATQSLEQAEITVEMVTFDDHAEIYVRDQGHGIAQEMVDIIFEPFATSRASGEGMGLGLAISTGIIHEHNGTLVARNLEEGGAEFTVTLLLQISQAGPGE